MGGTRVPVLGPAASVRVAAASSLLIALLALGGCSGAPGASNPASPPPADVASDENQLREATALLYPGFELVEYLGREEGVHYVVARRETVPSFVARLPFIKGSEWNKEVTVDGTLWSTSGDLTEATADAALLTGSLQTQTLESIVADAGLARGADGRYVHQLLVVSNVEITALVVEPDGQYSSYAYKLDMFQTPSRFVLKSKSEN